MAGGKLILLGEADAKLLRQLLTALEKAIPNMGGMSVGFYGLKDASGNNRLLKLLAADKEVGTPPSSGGGGLPAGVTFEAFTICVSGAPATRWLATWTTDPS